jgi:chitin synthase
MVYQFLNLIFLWFALVRLLLILFVALFSFIYIMQVHYYIAFSILSSALEDPSFNLKGIHVANIILNYCYPGLLIMCFVLALGNRPPGSTWPYTFAIVGFAFITIYMTVSALVLAFKGLDQLVKDNKGSLDLGDFFSNAISWNIVLSLAATLGLYMFASRALPRYLDAWVPLPIYLAVRVSLEGLTGLPPLLEAASALS